MTPGKLCKRRGRLLLGALAVLAACCTITAAVASTASDPAGLVHVRLSGGSLKAGRARVEALVENGGTRDLLGLRIAVYYDPLDALPAPDAPWRLHEFLLEPPLAPGSSASLSFSDDNAAQFVLLRCAYVRFALGISVDGGSELAAQHELLEQDGLHYIAARDLAAALGARLTQGADKRVTLTLPDSVHAGAGTVLIYLPGSSSVSASSEVHTLAHPVLERDGRSWLPLHAVCALLGYEADYELATNLLRLDSTAN